MARRRLCSLVAALVVAAVPALAGCGGDDDNAAASWADDVCTELSTWTTGVQDAVQSLSGGGLSEDAVRSAADEVKEATETLATGLRELGPPETEAGEQTKSALDELATELEQQLDQVEQAIDGDSGVLAVAQVVGTALSQSASAIQSTFNSIQEQDGAGELEDAFESSDACDSFEQQAEDLGSS